jgi:hypothetical protein
MTMNISDIARFREPADEEDYSGLRAEEVEIDELELEPNTFIQIDVQADFTHDGSNWVADVVWLKTFHRAHDGFVYSFIDKWTIATKENGYGAIVDAAEKWADKNLSPEDYR